jgi:hypothetical protein
MLTCHEGRHSKSDIEHSYYHRKEEGRVLMQTKRAYVIEIMTQLERVVGKEDLKRQSVRAHQYNMNSKKNFFFAMALRPNAGHDLLILEVSRPHTTTHHSQ